MRVHALRRVRVSLPAMFRSAAAVLTESIAQISFMTARQVHPKSSQLIVQHNSGRIVQIYLKSETTEVSA